MTSLSMQNNFQKYIPVVGDINIKAPLAYRVTRGAIALFNAVQMGFAESYINGLEVPDSLVKMLLNNSLPIVYKYFPSLLVTYDWILKESENLAEGSDRLIKIQYDLPEEMFVSMLEQDKIIYPKYTMALWEKGADNLLQAQKDMLDDLIEKIDIQDGDEILDVGCGWGSLCHYILAKFPNAKVAGLNLSHEQCQYIRRKMNDRNSYFNSERFTLYELDFNRANLSRKFDKIISLGVFEHIGNLTKSFQKLAAFLKDKGKVFIHIISLRLPNNGANPFLNKYIFPNMRVWNYDAIPSCDRDLKTIDKWFMNGENYSKTLKQWLNNFDRNQKKIKTLEYGIEYAKFRRIWRLYLLWCIAYFESCQGEILGNGQYLMVRS